MSLDEMWDKARGALGNSKKGNTGYCYFLISLEKAADSS
jgi:hypothetical protein